MNHDTPELRITITATFTAEPIREALGFWMDKLQRPCALSFSPLNQVFQQLLDPTSAVRTNTGINLVMIRFDDWCRIEDGFETEIKADAMVRQKIQRNVDDLVEALKTAAANSGAPYIVCVCPLSPILKADATYDFSDIEARLYDSLAAIDGIHPISADDIGRLYPVDDYYDFHADKLGHIPYKQIYFDSLAAIVARKIRAIKSAPYKVVVLDCDHTLWKGVCGEDALTSIEVDAGRDYLQRFMLRQAEAGALLCLASKNEESDVWSAFAGIAGMHIQRDHVVAHRINWQSKAGNIRALADELSLSLDSFIFIDDNAVECAEVAATCPQVVTLCLPQNADDIPAYLDHVWAFDRLAATREDSQRTELYRQQAQRQRFQTQSNSFADFLRGLEMSVDIHPLDSSSIARAAQLTQRVNQFNVSGVRYNETELTALLQDAAVRAYTVDVRDRFGDYGMVGLMLCRLGQHELKLVNMLLSCRALGKGVEHRMLAALGACAQAEGLVRVRIELVPTDKNAPAQGFLQQVAGAYHTVDQGKRFYELPASVATAIDFADYLDVVPPAVAAAAHEGGDALERADSPVNWSEVFDDIARNLNTPKKITTAVLAASQAKLTGSSEYVAPRNDIEKTVAAIWTEVLDIEKIGVADNFFALGGESIKAIQILARIREEFSIELPMTVLFADSITVESLSQAVEAALLSNVDEDALAAELAAIENMSEEEIERLLSQAE